MAAYKRIAVVSLLVLAGGGIWIAREYRSDIDHARARVVTGSQVIATPCGPIEYAELGTGPPILSVHGAGGGFDQGLALASPFAAKGYRVIAMSRFGYLRTPAPPRPSIALQADAHACLLDALGVSRAAVIGVSAGAPSALEFALRYPARCTALVLVVPGWFPTTGSSSRRMGPTEVVIFERLLHSDFLFWAMARLLPTVADRAVLGTPPEVVATGSTGEQTRVAAVLRDILPVSQRQVGLSLEGELTVERLSKPLEAMSVPTLTISAEDDLYGTYANAQFIARHIPNCRFVGYPSGGHMLVGHNDDLTATVILFLDEPG